MIAGVALREQAPLLAALFIVLALLAFLFALIFGAQWVGRRIL